MTARGTSSDPPPSWRRGAAILAIAVMMLVLIYFGAGFLFNRTNPQREGRDQIPVPHDTLTGQQVLSFPYRTPDHSSR